MASPLLLRDAAATGLVSMVIYFLFTQCIIIISGVFHAVMPSAALVFQPFAKKSKTVVVFDAILLGRAHTGQVYSRKTCSKYTM